MERWFPCNLLYYLLQFFLINMSLFKSIKNNKNFLNLILIVLLFFVFTQEFKIFKNTYNLITKDYYTRATLAYKKSFFSGFCKGSAHGYLYFIKGNYSKKFHKNTIPKIINNFNGKKEYWLFYNLNAKINDDQIIILNKKNDIDLEKYNIIHQYKNQCFFVEKKND